MSRYRVTALRVVAPSNSAARQQYQVTSGAVWAERIAERLEFTRGWSRNVPGQSVSPTNPVVTDRPDVEPSQLKHEEIAEDQGPMPRTFDRPVVTSSSDWRDSARGDSATVP